MRSWVYWLVCPCLFLFAYFFVNNRSITALAGVFWLCAMANRKWLWENVRWLWHFTLSSLILIVIVNFVCHPSHNQHQSYSIQSYSLSHGSFKTGTQRSTELTPDIKNTPPWNQFCMHQVSDWIEWKTKRFLFVLTYDASPERWGIVNCMHPTTIWPMYVVHMGDPCGVDMQI